MGPGSELDALIADKVFDCKVHRRTDSGFRHECNCVHHEHAKGDSGNALKEYSYDIEDAWVVAQTIKDLDEDNVFEIHLSDTKHKECTVAVKFWDQSNPDDPVLAGTFYILGESAPHAICLAALKALGITY